MIELDCMQVDVRTFRGAVPSEARDAEWKVTYRKQLDQWSLQLYCHETALVNNEAHVQPTIIVYSEHDKVIQVTQQNQSLLVEFVSQLSN